ncbi:MAG TPA: DUF3618 domain-containing protein [Gaiellaceae bacterium]|jgi:hypothetical protein
MPAQRTPEQVRSDIAAERDQLASAVEELRGSLGEAADLTGKLRAKLPVVASGAAAAGFVFAGGIGATMRYLARRGREPNERVRVGRFSILDRE